MSRKLSDNELKELFIKVVRPYEEQGRKKNIDYESPYVEKIKEFVTLKFVKESGAQKQAIQTLTEPNAITLACRNNEKEVRALMRHLRNCIAHCIIREKDDNSYELVDKDESKDKDKQKTYHTMLGNIGKDQLNKLVDYVNIENKKLNSKKKSKPTEDVEKIIN